MHNDDLPKDSIKALEQRQSDIMNDMLDNYHNYDRLRQLSRDYHALSWRIERQQRPIKAGATFGTEYLLESSLPKNQFNRHQ